MLTALNRKLPSANCELENKNVFLKIVFPTTMQVKKNNNNNIKLVECYCYAYNIVYSVLYNMQYVY